MAGAPQLCRVLEVARLGLVLPRPGTSNCCQLLLLACPRERRHASQSLWGQNGVSPVTWALSSGP